MSFQGLISGGLLEILIKKGQSISRIYNQGDPSAWKPLKSARALAARCC